MRAEENKTPAKATFLVSASESGSRSAETFSGPSSSAAEVPRNVGAYAVQCEKCFKFRQIPTLEEYERIRENFIEQPWTCDMKPDVSCDGPADLECDSSAIWVIDKPNIPKAPAGCKRVLIMRKDLSKMDALYVMPTGKKVRSPRDVEQFLEACPRYKGQFSVSDFNFTVPKIMKAME